MTFSKTIEILKFKMQRKKKWRLRMKEFTEEELKKFDGKDGRPAYTAYDGKVYDATGNHEFRNGLHSGIHPCGVDLTDEMLDAPHGDDVMDRLPVIGRLLK